MVIRENGRYFRVVFQDMKILPNNISCGKFFFRACETLFRAFETRFMITSESHRFSIFYIIDEKN